MGDSSIFHAKKLISVNGKASPPSHVPRTNSGLKGKVGTPKPISQSELVEAATIRRTSFHNLLAEQIDRHVQQQSGAATSARKSSFNDDLWKELPAEAGYAKLAETQWDHMTGKHLSPAQRAELCHVRNMMASLKQQIATLNSSL